MPHFVFHLNWVQFRRRFGKLLTASLAYVTVLDSFVAILPKPSPVVSWFNLKDEPKWINRTIIVKLRYKTNLKKVKLNEGMSCTYLIFGLIATEVAAESVRVTCGYDSGLLLLVMDPSPGLTFLFSDEVEIGLFSVKVCRLQVNRSFLNLCATLRILAIAQIFEDLFKDIAFRRHGTLDRGKRYAQ